MASLKGDSSDPNTAGVLGVSHNTASGVIGVNDFSPAPGRGGNGGAFESAEGEGVRGTAKNSHHAGVVGKNSAGGIGVFGESLPADGIGVFGQSDAGVGVKGLSHGQFRNAVVGVNDFSAAGPGAGGNGGFFESAQGEGVRGTAKNSHHAGVVGKNSAGGKGVVGESLQVGGVGVHGKGVQSGVTGESENGVGVFGVSTTLHGVSGISHHAKGAGVFGQNDGGGLAASFIGAIQATGDVTCHHVACQDVFCRGGDIAEEFPVTGNGDATPGTVMVLGDDGALKPSDTPYDGRVAGVIAGAGDYRPGILLDRQTQAGRLPIAMVGKAYCMVDATYAAVGIGDLLTSSGTAGHAMKAVDPARAFGAVIGKAMRPLVEGRSLIPILLILG